VHYGTRTSAATPTTTSTTTTTTLPTSSTTVPLVHIVVVQTEQVAGPGSTPELTVLQALYEVGYTTVAACQWALKVVAP
jgi:hypothetical protein